LRRGLSVTSDRQSLLYGSTVPPLLSFVYVVVNFSMLAGGPVAHALCLPTCVGSVVESGVYTTFHE
jgi:hypothetical protein